MICQKHEVEELLLALPGVSQKRLRGIVEQLQGLNVRLQTIPAMEAVIEGQVKVSQIRDVDIKDLLGREQVDLDTVKIREYLQDQRVLVTGAGGSIGSEICRQIMRFCPARLVLLEQAEGALFENMISSSAWTLPAHAAMFTGLAGTVHGAVETTKPLPADPTW